VTEAAADDVEAGHAFYTKRSLAVYDAMILGFFSRVAWRCPASRVLAHYDAHVSANHLDIGVGTGWFLDRCTFPATPPRLALLDPNLDCLDKAGRRTARYSPEKIQADILQPLEYGGPAFDSVGLNYVLHCLPGTIHDKGVVFDHIKAVAKPGAAVFGGTLLHDGVRRSGFARAVMRRNNKHRIFSNRHDDLAGFTAALNERFSTVTVETVGCVALFAARV
jgi:hypothetical protein